MRPSLIALQLLVASSLLLSCPKMPTSPKVMVPVSGTILDRDGHGIQAVYVFFEGPTDAPALDLQSRHAVTDLNGNFSTEVPEGDYRVLLLPPDFSAYAGTYFNRHIGPGTTIRYRFVWSRVAVRPSFSGTQGPADLLIYAYPRSYEFLSQRGRLSGNEQEVFVAPGTYDLVLDASGVGFGYLERVLIMQVSADTTVDVAFTGSPVSIHVTGQGGDPLAGARLEAASNPDHAYATADAAGSATVYLPAGTYRLAARGPTDDVLGRTLANVPISGSASFDFDLSGAVWTGVLRRASDGSPVTDAYVEVYDPIERMNAMSSTVVNGSFHLVVRSGRFDRLAVIERIGDAYGEVAHIDSVPAGADSTFDIIVNASPTAPNAPGLRPAPPAGRDAPASAAAGRGSPRRSSRTSG